MSPFFHNFPDCRSALFFRALPGCFNTLVPKFLVASAERLPKEST